MKIVVSAASGIEAVTKRELNKLGISDAPALNGRISFEGDIKDLAACNLYLSTAGHVYLSLAEFKCSSFDELFDAIKEVPLENYIPANAKIIVEAKLVSSTLTAYSATQSVAKKAIVERLLKAYRVRTLSETGARYNLEISILKDHATLYLNTSGEGLHRRGYRPIVGGAQIKETLAAALIDLSVWRPDRPFADIFCGTGTIAIEAALKARNIPCGINRDFDFLHHSYFDKRVFDEMKAEAVRNIRPNLSEKIYAADIDENQLALCKKHAKFAGVEKDIIIERKDMRDFAGGDRRGVVISNPPYGERLSDRAHIEELYRALGKVAAKNNEWCFYTLTPVDDFERLFGKSADKKRKLFNGRIQCYYYAHLAEKSDSPKKKS